MTTLETLVLKGNAIDRAGSEAILSLVRSNQNLIKVNLDLNILKPEIM